MTSKNRLALAVAAVTLITAIASAASVDHAEAGILKAPKTCKPFATIGYGKPRVLKVAARMSARNAWVTRVTNSPVLGPTWANWSIAAQKSFNCKKIGFRWTCTASARACKN